MKYLYWCVSLTTFGNMSQGHLMLYPCKYIGVGTSLGGQMCYRQLTAHTNTGKTFDLGFKGGPGGKRYSGQIPSPHQNIGGGGIRLAQTSCILLNQNHRRGGGHLELCVCIFFHLYKSSSRACKGDCTSFQQHSYVTCPLFMSIMSDLLLIHLCVINSTTITSTRVWPDLCFVM